MNDNLNRTVENISDIAREIDLIAKVDSFYNSAWNKLIIVGSVAFAIVGVIVPFVIQWYQKRTLKLSEEIMKKEFSEHKKILKEEIYKEVAHEIENKFEKLKIFYKEAIPYEGWSTYSEISLKYDKQIVCKKKE